MIQIRNETKDDFRAVEEMLKKAFWNVNFPGADEHYLLHVIREQPLFVPELDLIIEEDGVIIGSVAFVRSKLVGASGREKEILSFGPLGIHPDYQRKGCGKRLLDFAFDRAREMGFEAVANFGNPENYIPRGMKSCKRYNVCLEKGVFPVALLVKELREGALDGEEYWIFRESEAYAAYSPDGFDEFDSTFEQMEKGYMPSQELFYIYSQSRLRPD